MGMKSWSHAPYTSTQYPQAPPTPPHHMCQGHFCTQLGKELPIIPSLHRLSASHYAHDAGIPSSCFSHAHLASVSSSADQATAGL